MTGRRKGSVRKSADMGTIARDYMFKPVFTPVHPTV